MVERLDVRRVPGGIEARHVLMQKSDGCAEELSFVGWAACELGTSYAASTTRMLPARSHGHASDTPMMLQSIFAHTCEIFDTSHRAGKLLCPGFQLSSLHEGLQHELPSVRHPGVIAQGSASRCFSWHDLVAQWPGRIPCPHGQSFAWHRGRAGARSNGVPSYSFCICYDGHRVRLVACLGVVQVRQVLRFVLCEVR